MKIFELKAREKKIVDKQGAISLLAEFLSSPSAQENTYVSISLKDYQFGKFVETAKTFADTWDIAFEPSLYVATMILHKNEESTWNSSTGSCGWVNSDEVEE